MPVPVWVIILAVLAGLLLLAVLVFVMYRVSDGLRKRGREGKQKKRRRERRKKGEKKGRDRGVGHLIMRYDEHSLLFEGRKVELSIMLNFLGHIMATQNTFCILH